MGERLNLEIRYNNKPLANSYYHWSGYTRSALELTENILDEMISRNWLTGWNNSKESIVKAIRLLETTEAGMSTQ